MYKSFMVRTQLYLPENEHQKLTLLAKEKGLPMAEVVRSYINIGLELEGTENKAGINLLKRLAHMNVKKGPSDLSSNLDNYIYNLPKKR